MRHSPILREQSPIITAQHVVVAGSAFFAVWWLFAVGQLFIPAVQLTPYAGGDFSQFYIAGKLLNDGQRAALYDVELHARMFRELHGAGSETSLWYAYGPTLAMLFRPLSLLPFAVAYGVWCILACLLYIDGLRSLSPFLAGVPAEHRRAMFALALSFLPFAGWSLTGGQVSVIAYALFARAIAHDLRGDRFMAGIMLSLCVYKPTMLFAIGPCVLVRGNWRLLSGFAAGLLASFGAIAATLGAAPIVAWGELLLRYSRFAGGAATPWPQNWPLLIDINHFFQRIIPDTTGARIAAAAVVIPVFILLLAHWRRFDRLHPDLQRTLWAAAVTATLLLNVYTMLYDAILVTISILLILGVAYRNAESLKIVSLKAWALGIYGSALIPGSLTRLTHVQFFTVALVGLLVWQYRALSRLRAKAEDQCSSAPANAAAL